MGKKISTKILKLNTEAIKNQVIKERKKYTPTIPAYVNKIFEVDEFVQKNGKSYRLIPKNAFDGKFIVYLYGSEMCHNILDVQWEFITKLAQKTGAGLFVPMYPLAPESSCREVFEMLEMAYSNFSKGFDIEKLILLGDGSGAGLALSLSMIAWKEGMRKPDQLIMLSPALDTEYFDKKLEQEVLASVHKEHRYFHSEAMKDFLNTYWVKDYAVKTEYTSPFYEDYTDICDDVVLFSGEEDMYNCYARAFYTKAKQQGVNVRFFEFENENHNFMIHSKSYESKNAYGYLLDVINGTYENSLYDIYSIKLMSNWSKKFPEVFEDRWASKFIYENKFDFSTISTKLSEYRDAILASNCTACDEKVKRYILKFPNCTIVNVGCKLGNMFDRVDNGRIQWYSVDTHNIMSVRRAMYGEREREKNVGRSLMDFSWLEDINCKRNQGIMFVCNETLSYLNIVQVKDLIYKIWEKFPGAELVFTAETSGATFLSNRKHNNTMTTKKRKMAINDAQKTMNSWRTDFRIISEEPVTDYLGEQKELKWTTKMEMKYNKMAFSHKIIHVKLGSESFEINV